MIKVVPSMATAAGRVTVAPTALEADATLRSTVMAWLSSTPPK